MKTLKSKIYKLSHKVAKNVKSELIFFIMNYNFISLRQTYSIFSIYLYVLYVRLSLFRAFKNTIFLSKEKTPYSEYTMSCSFLFFVLSFQ